MTVSGFIVIDSYMSRMVREHYLQAYTDNYMLTMVREHYL